MNRRANLVGVLARLGQLAECSSYADMGRPRRAAIDLIEGSPNQSEGELSISTSAMTNSIDGHYPEYYRIGLAQHRRSRPRTGRRVGQLRVGEERPRSVHPDTRRRFECRGVDAGMLRRHLSKDARRIKTESGRWTTDIAWWTSAPTRARPDWRPIAPTKQRSLSDRTTDRSCASSRGPTGTSSPRSTSPSMRLD
jgi:hypothetical protein